ncbi:MAG: glycosyltransferase family 4 protein [Desulfobacterales bacterium]|jgi:glycosyltransferase involved in cell wall biosynthesis
MKLNIGMVSTRFAGLDGVSLEAAKWTEVLEEMGHCCYWLAGELDRPARRSILVPEAHFQSDVNRWISRQIFDRRRRSPQVLAAIHDQRTILRFHLEQFIDRFRIDCLIVENALSIPMQIPLGLALTEIIAERTIPAILHHHDFYWERPRYAHNTVADYMQSAFPPSLPSAMHVVINSIAREQLARRCQQLATLIPNVLDFSRPPDVDRTVQRKSLRTMGIHPEDIVILQPTRIVQRKGIEHAVDLVHKLNLPNCKLIVSHAAGDEGMTYAHWLKRYAARHQVDLKFLDIQTRPPTENNPGFFHQYRALWELYERSDFVTFPSLTEGFGNALLEAIYFRKPLLVNRYDTFVKDIEPLDFDLVTIDGVLTRRHVETVRHLLSCPERLDQMTAHNYEIARQHFSYQQVRSRLQVILETARTTIPPARSEGARPSPKTIIPLKPLEKQTAPSPDYNTIKSGKSGRRG